MRGRRPAGSLLLICTGLVITALLLFVKNALPSDSAGRDGQLVFCLSAAQRPPLAGAAVTLGLAQPAAVPGELTVAGHAVTLPQWRHDHAADFDRACAALAAAQPQAAPGGGLASDLWSVGSVLASVLVGAALAWMNGEWRATAERNRSQAEALSTAAQAFTQTADTYIADWLAPRAGGTPDDRPLRARRRELAAQLSGVQATHRRWADVIAGLRTQLVDGELGESITSSLAASQRTVPQRGTGDSARDRRAAELRQLLGQFEEDVGSVAAALQRAAAWRRDSSVALYVNRRATTALPAPGGIRT